MIVFVIMFFWAAKRITDHGKNNEKRPPELPMLYIYVIFNVTSALMGNIFFHVA